MRQEGDSTGRREDSAAIGESISDTLINSLPGIFYLYDQDWRLVLWNKRHEEVLGYTAEEHLGKHVLDFFEGADREIIRRGVERVFAEGKAEAEAELTTKSGRKIPYYFTGVMIVLDGKPHFLGLGIDMAERKQSEAALRESEARSREMAELFPEIVFESDAQGNIIYLNRVGIEKSGYSSEDLEAGLHILQLTTPDDRARGLERLGALLTGGGKAQGEYTALRKDGTTFPVAIRASRVTHDGKTAGVRGIAMDVSEQVATERALSARAERIMRFHKCLLNLSRVDLADPGARMRQIVEADAQALQVEQVGVWFFDDQGTAIVCDDLYKQSTGVHEAGPRLEACDYPRYFAALKANRAIAATDACNDPDTSEFSEIYLRPRGVTSLLDAPVWLHGKIIGVVCHEHTGPMRVWLPEEQDFAASIADMISLTVEASDRRRVEDALGRSEEEFRQLVENVPIGVYRSTPEGKMLMANATMVHMLGYSCFEELANRDLDTESNSHGYARSAYKDKIEREGRIVGLESVWTRSDGSLIHVRENARAIFDAAGKAIYYEGTIEDITEMKWAEAQLREYQEHLKDLVKARTAELEEANRQLQDEIREREQLEVDLIRAREAAESANRAKSAFLANMSHGIRTPMNAILGYAQILERDPGIGEAQREYVNVINRSGEHLLGLINDVLEMSKIEAGRATLNSEHFDLPAILGDIESMFRVRCNEKGLALCFASAGTLPQHLCGDGGKIRDVLINLLGNAVKFTDSGGITVRSKALGGDGAPGGYTVVIDVEDTGCGIAEDETVTAFQPFEQTRSGRFQGSGTGLGLPISREYARMMGGDLTVESVVGMGSTFRFTFKAAAVDPSALRGDETGLARQVIGLVPDRPAPRVLVVDDDDASREALSLHLEIIGFTVRCATNGAEAVSAVEDWNPDVVLMDLWMPEVGGIEATRRIKALPGGRPTPVLAVSASVLADSEQEARAAGADGFIRKPFRKAEVFGEIARVLGVEYLYEEERRSDGCGAAELDAEAAGVPPEVVCEITEAAEAGNGAALRALLELHRDLLGAELRDALPRLAKDYEYGKIVEILSKAVATGD